MTSLGAVARVQIALFVLIDGLFHLLSSLTTFQRFAPDWIISGYFGNAGFGVLFHKIIGIGLIILSILAILYANNEEFWYKVYYYAIAPITLGTIMIAILITIYG